MVTACVAVRSFYSVLCVSPVACAGNIYADPLLLLPGNAGRKNLQRMNDAVAAGKMQQQQR